MQSSLDALEAQRFDVPAMEPHYLGRGHAVHFRCFREDVAKLRIDLMSTLRRVADFEELWARRTTIEVDAEPIDMLSLPDLVLAKKTQRDKYWPMIARLVEQSYFNRDETIEFWLREPRTPTLLVEAAAAHPEQAITIAVERPAVQAAVTGDIEAVAIALATEEAAERARDRAWWEPLKRELEQFRMSR